MSERLLLGAVLARQREAWGRGRRARVEEWLAEHPHLANDENAVLDLVYSERLLREEDGEAPLPAEYLARFPRLAGALRLMFEVDDALSDIGETTVPEAESLEGVPRLEGLEVLGELGRGSMGVVYRGWQTAAKRPVAVKVLSADMPPARARAEAEAVARLQHPNIVQVYDVREREGRTVLVLEYVEGGNLAQKLAGRPQSPREAAGLIETLARAMQYAHERGVIHRDLKPSNVLISSPPDAPLWRCVPKVNDFGLAKLTEGGLNQTRTNEMLGTPGYMAPEQAGRGDLAVGAATDVYALGAVLYELLTGRPPFLGETLLETLEQVHHQEPVPPSRLQPKVPHDLEVVCLKCLHKLPTKRYATAKDLADDLGRFQRGEPIRGRPVGVGERVWKWARRRPGAALASAVAVGAAVFLLVAGVVVNGWLVQERDAAREQAKELDASVKQLRVLLYTGQLLRVGTVWPSDPREGLRMLEDPEACPPELRCFSWGVLREQCRRYRDVSPDLESPVTALTGGEVVAIGTEDGRIRLQTGEGRALRAWRAHIGRVSHLAFRRDGKRLASGGPDGKVHVWNLEDRELRVSLPAGVEPGGLAWSPDGARLYVNAGGEVSAWDAETGRRRRRFPGDTHRLSGVAVSPDGSTVASGSPSSRVLTWGTTTGRPGSEGIGHDAPPSALLFGPDGNLYTGGLDGVVRVWTLTADAMQDRDALRAGVGPVTGLALRGEVLAVSGLGPLATEPGEWPADVQLWTRRVGAEPLRGHGGAAGVCFSADGKTLVTAGRDGTVKRWDHPGRPSRVPVPGHVGERATLAMARDRRVMAWFSRGEGVWVREWEAGEARLLVAGHDRPTVRVALSHDGRLTATASDPGELLIWETATGRLLHVLEGQRAEAAALAFEGDRLATAGRDGVVRLWDAKTGASAGERDAGGPLRDLALAGERVAVLRDDGRVVTWSGGGRRIDAGQGEAMALSNDGEWLATASGGTLRLASATGKRKGTATLGMARVASLAFGPAGDVLAVAGSGSGVRLVDTATMQERASLPRHPGGAVFVAIGGDGRLVATAGAVGGVRLWYRGG